MGHEGRSSGTVGRILILASLERASGLFDQLESWNGSKTRGTLSEEHGDEILQRATRVRHVRAG